MLMRPHQCSFSDSSREDTVSQKMSCSSGERWSKVSNEGLKGGIKEGGNDIILLNFKMF